MYPQTRNLVHNSFEIIGSQIHLLVTIMQICLENERDTFDRSQLLRFFHSNFPNKGFVNVDSGNFMEGFSNSNI